mmetsp:Transcript_47164/g.125300  ORF Transcript_47164/g.125300 Transcript_47164/m.125300 type:complete len:329 (-) Transcript_47164:1003-1989(-)
MERSHTSTSHFSHGVSQSCPSSASDWIWCVATSSTSPPAHGSAARSTGPSTLCTAGCAATAVGETPSEATGVAFGEGASTGDAWPSDWTPKTCSSSSALKVVASSASASGDGSMERSHTSTWHFSLGLSQSCPPSASDWIWRVATSSTSPPADSSADRSTSSSTLCTLCRVDDAAGETPSLATGVVFGESASTGTPWHGDRIPKTASSSSAPKGGKSSQEACVHVAWLSKFCWRASAAVDPSSPHGDDASTIRDRSSTESSAEYGAATSCTSSSEEGSHGNSYPSTSSTREFPVCCSTGEHSDASLGASSANCDATPWTSANISSNDC